MKMYKKLLALLLSGSMVLGLAACGGTQGNTETPGGESTPPVSESQAPQETGGAAATDPDSIPDTMTSEDGKYQVAFVTDVGPAEGQVLQPGYL